MTTEKVELESELDYTDDEDIDEGCEAEASAPAFTVTGFWGERLDKVMAAMLPDVSRARLQKLIEGGKVAAIGPRDEILPTLLDKGESCVCMDRE